MKRIKQILKDIAAGTILIVPVVTCVNCEKGNICKDEDIINGWGQPVISVACMREEPRHGAELVSQCLLGEPIAIMMESGEWLDIKTSEGYRGWVNQSSIARKSEAEMKQWRQSSRLVVDSPTEIRVYKNDNLAGEVITDLVDGCIVEYSLTADTNVVTVTLPDGRSGYADAGSFIEIAEWSNQEYDAEKIISRAYALTGVPYLWGGLSTKSMDCSGLIKLCYRANGIIVPRDASQQADCGTTVNKEDLKKGDLLFFGNKETRRVTHVGIYEGNDMYIHCSGRVRRNSLDPSSPEYMDKYYLSSRRIHGETGDDGAVKVKIHPWYFQMTDN